MMKKSHNFISRVLTIQQERTQELEVKHSKQENTLQSIELLDLKNSATLTNINNKIKNFQKNNQLLQDKINNQETYSTSFNYLSHKIKLIRNEIEDLTQLKLEHQTKHLEEEALFIREWSNQESVLDQEFINLVKKKNQLQKHKIELETKLIQQNEEFRQQTHNINSQIQLYKEDLKKNNNLRCSERNKNLDTIINFQKKYKNIIPTTNKLKNILQQKNTELENLLDDRKIEYQNLLMNHLCYLQKNQNQNPQKKVKINEILYNKVLQEQKNYELETKNLKNQSLKEIQLIEQRLQQFTTKLTRIQSKFQLKKLNHLESLKNIKSLKFKKKINENEIELQQLKLYNQIEIIDNNIHNFNLELDSLLLKKKNLKNHISQRNIHIPNFLNCHLQIQQKEKIIIIYESQIEKLKKKKNKIEKLYYLELTHNKNKILHLKQNLLEEQNNQKIIKLRKNLILEQNRLQKQKHIKDNNKKILQELDTLSKILS